MLIIKDNLINFISNQNRILIIPGDNNIYDTLPASLSISLISQSLNITPSIITNQKIPSTLSFLPFNRIITLSSSFLEKSRYGVLAIGCTDNEIEKIKKDENLSNSSLFIIKPKEKSISCCEEITHTIRKGNIKISPIIATSLMTGIIIQNENLQNKNTTPQSLFAMSYLSLNGANKSLITNTLFHKTSINFIKLWSILLKRITYIKEHNMAYTHIEEGLDTPEIQTEEIHNIIKEMRNITPFAKFIIIGIQTHKTLICIVSIIEGNTENIQKQIKTTTYNNSFSIPIQKTKSTKEEIISLGSTISAII